MLKPPRSVWVQHRHLPMASPERGSNPPSPTTTQITPVLIAQTRLILKEETEREPLQQQLPVTRIKSELEDECKPAIAAPATSAAANGEAAQPPAAGATILPTVPININLGDLQSVLRRLLGRTNRVATQGKQGTVVQQPQQQIIRLPAFVDRDGTRKIIINYSIRPAAAKTNTSPLPTVAAAAAAAPTSTSTPTKTGRPSTPEVTDLSVVKPEPESVAITTDTEAETITRTQATSNGAQTARMPKAGGGGTCLLCDNCPDNLEALHLLQHRKAADGEAEGEAVDSAALDPPVKLEEPPVDDLLSLLKTYFASDANPGERELTKISESVSIPVDVVRKWFVKMNSGRNAGSCFERATAVSTKTESDASDRNGEAEEDDSRDTGDLVIVKTEPEDPDSVDSRAEQLDLSVPKPPLSPTCPKKERLERRTVYLTAPRTGRAANTVTAAQLRTLAAIAGHGRVRCLSAINTKTKSTVLIPELTYATVAGSTTGAKTVILNGHKKASNVEPTAAPAAQRETGAERPMKAKRCDGHMRDHFSYCRKVRPNGDLYSCDLCSKVFHKKCLLLRHRCEPTGKRPHECHASTKASGHKQQRVDASGEKPNQCDEGAARLSRPDSPSSGHTRDHFSYCRKIRLNFGSASRPRGVLSKLGGPRPMAAERRTRPKKRPDGRSDGVPAAEDHFSYCRKIRLNFGSASRPRRVLSRLGVPGAELRPDSRTEEEEDMTGGRGKLLRDDDCIGTYRFCSEETGRLALRSVFASDVDEATEEVAMSGMENHLRDDSNVSAMEVE